jgi:tRNA (cytidine/uridine-2'-O-)-methyltransferase
MPLDVILFQPEIPPNTGNIIRLCANTGARLHLIKPLGFWLDARAVRRAGLDYHELAEVREYASLQACFESLRQPRWFVFTTRGRVRHDEAQYAAGDALVFGPETRGLPEDVIARCPPERRVRIPMLGQARSLNLSNAVAVAVYEAWRQSGWTGTGDDPR